jgi:hypothetical protein
LLSFDIDHSFCIISEFFVCGWNSWPKDALHLEDFDWEW